MCGRQSWERSFQGQILPYKLEAWKPRECTKLSLNSSKQQISGWSPRRGRGRKQLSMGGWRVSEIQIQFSIFVFSHQFCDFRVLVISHVRWKFYPPHRDAEMTKWVWSLTAEPGRQMCDADYMMSSQSGSDRETNIALYLHKGTKDHSLARAHENTTCEGTI